MTGESREWGGKWTVGKVPYWKALSIESPKDDPRDPKSMAREKGKAQGRGGSCITNNARLRGNVQPLKKPRARDSRKGKARGKDFPRITSPLRDGRPIRGEVLTTKSVSLQGGKIQNLKRFGVSNQGSNQGGGGGGGLGTTYDRRPRALNTKSGGSPH